MLQDTAMLTVNKLGKCPKGADSTVALFIIISPAWHFPQLQPLLLQLQLPLLLQLQLAGQFFCFWLTGTPVLAELCHHLCTHSSTATAILAPSSLHAVLHNYEGYRTWTQASRWVLCASHFVHTQLEVAVDGQTTTCNSVVICNTLKPFGTSFTFKSLLSLWNHDK